MPDSDLHARDLEPVEALVHTLLALVREHEGRLVGAVIGAPRTSTSPISADQIERALADVGIDFVDVRLRLDAGPLRLLSAEFER
jgi:hypothetical protein